MLSVSSLAQKFSKNASPAADHNSIELHAVSPAATSSSSVSGEDVCPITMETIAGLNPKDVHKTLDGISYYRPALKLWLREHDTMPHNNCSAAQEKERLFGADIAEQKKETRAINLRRFGANALGATSALTLPTGVGLLIKSIKKNTDISEIQAQGKAICPGPQIILSCRKLQTTNWCDQVDTDTRAMDSCIADHVQTILASYHKAATLYRPMALAFLGVGVGLALAAVLLTNLNKRRQPLDLEANRPVSAADLQAMSAALDAQAEAAQPATRSI